MTFENYNLSNNAFNALLQTPISNTGTQLIVKDGRGELFPTSNFFIKIEKVNSVGSVTRREGIRVLNRTGDIFFLQTRGAYACPANDTVNEQTQTPFSFDENDIITLSNPVEIIEDLQDEVVRLENDKLNNEDYLKSRLVYGASSTGNDDYQITVTGVDAYVDGATYRFKADVANNGPSTLQINALGAIDLKKNQGQDDLITGDVAANGIVTATYNSTGPVFQFVGQEATVVAPNVISTNSSYTAGENLTIGDALCIRPSMVTISNGNAPTITNVSTSVGQTFTTGDGTLSVSKVKGRLRNGGTAPVVEARIYSAIGGTLLGTSNQETLTNSILDDIEFTFTSAVSVSDNSSGVYLEFFRVSGNLQYGYNASNSYLGGQRVVNGAATTGDIGFQITINNSNSSGLVRTNADDETRTNFVGFAGTNTTSGDQVTVNTAGVNTNQESMTPGALQYLKPGTKIEDASGISYSTSGDSGTDRGLTFQSKANQKFIRAKISSLASGYTRCRLLDNTGTLLQDGLDQGGGVFLFDYDIVNGTSYRITADDNGGPYVMAFTNSNPGYPITGTNIDFTGPVGFQGAMIESVTTSSEEFGTISEEVSDVVVGKALSETNILIETISNPSPRPRSITATRSNTAASGVITYTHGLNAIPSIIEVTAGYGGGSSTPPQSEGTWENDGNNTNKCRFDQFGGQAGLVSSGAAIVVQETDSDGQVGIIQNVTSTTFDVSYEYIATPTARTISMIFKILP